MAKTSGVNHQAAGSDITATDNLSEVILVGTHDLSAESGHTWTSFSFASSSEIGDDHSQKSSFDATITHGPNADILGGPIYAFRAPSEQELILDESCFQMQRVIARSNSTPIDLTSIRPELGTSLLAHLANKFPPVQANSESIQLRSDAEPERSLQACVAKECEGLRYQYPFNQEKCSAREVQILKALHAVSAPIQANGETMPIVDNSELRVVLSELPDSPSEGGDQISESDPAKLPPDESDTNPTVADLSPANTKNVGQTWALPTGDRDSKRDKVHLDRTVSPSSAKNEIQEDVPVGFRVAAEAPRLEHPQEIAHNNPVGTPSNEHRRGYSTSYADFIASIEKERANTIEKIHSDEPVQETGHILTHKR